jgi:hypothetical protein
MPKYKEAPLCDFRKIELRIPSNSRLRLIKLAYKPNYLSEEELIFCKT